MEQQKTQKQHLKQALGAEIARVRIQAGMKQADLARASGLSPRQISKIETGAALAPTVTTMRKIENALGLPPAATDEFMAGVIDRLNPRSASNPEDYEPGGIYHRGDPRDEVEAAMLATRGETADVKWRFVFDHRERMRDEAAERKRLGRSG